MPGQWHRLSPVAIGSMRRFGAGCRAWLGGATVVAKGTDEATAPLHPLSPSARPVFHAAVVAAPSLGAAAVVVAVGLPTLLLPFWPDQAIFSLIGRTIAHGGFPYVDAWDQKPPSIYFIYALAIHGPLDVMQNVRAFDLAWTVATVLVLCELGRRWWTVRAGVIAGLGYGVVYLTSSGWARLAQPDSFIGLPLALALLLYEAARGRRGYLITAGVLLGFAFQLRFIMALLIPVIPLVELTTAPPGHRVRLGLHRMGWLGAGFIAFQVGVAAYLLVGGALGAYLDATRWAAAYTRADWPWPGG
ncbi:MAG: glycosyltransferase family 39 protein, partial [Dehalococcoidia bacterium]